MALSTSPFGHQYTLQHPDSELQIGLIDFGATVTHLLAPDRNGQLADVLLGCESAEGYTRPHPHFNCIVGRYSNRITNAKFELDGQEFSLDRNIPPHHLHGGRRGFASRLWSSRRVYDGVEFRLTSPDGDQGYPGELSVSAVYTLRGSSLRLEVRARTTKPTPVSLTAHHYFNLSNRHGTVVDNHEMRIDADAYLPVSDELTQLGRTENVADTPFDFRKSVRLGTNLASSHPQVRLADGIDHTFVLSGDATTESASVVDPESGRRLVIRTNQPGVQLYTCNTLSYIGKKGVRYGRHCGFCLETQQFPDAPNQPTYPDPTLRPGEEYFAVTEYELKTT